MYVCKVNGRAEALGQPLRGCDSLNRQLREIDRHQNISDAQFFHGWNMSRPSEVRISLLVKSNSVLALARATFNGMTKARSDRKLQALDHLCHRAISQVAQ